MQLLAPLPLALALCSGLVPSGSWAREGCGAACEPPILDPPEPALRRAVHLGWRDPERDLARVYEVERRSSGAEGAWVPVARLPADRPPHLDDAGPGGSGLPPGRHEYRVRALHRSAEGEVWTGWSVPS